MADLIEKIQRAKTWLEARTQNKPAWGIILGTGLGSLTQAMKIAAEIDYDQIPHFVQSTVESHKSKLIFGEISGKSVVVMQGRFHYYEGYSMEEITFPVRVMKALGVHSLIVSNIAGGLNPQFNVGDLMVITDHINLLGTNPLIGKNYEELGPRFPDMIEPYSKAYVQALVNIALKQGLAVHKGVYSCMSGPSLETAAEYRMLRIIGADAIGMSTVPEVITAVHTGLKVLGISLISDLCMADNLKAINIVELMKVAAEVEPKLTRLVQSFLQEV